MRPALLLVTIAVCAPAPAHAQGLSARFGHLRAVEGESFVVRLELEDQGCGGPPGLEPCRSSAVHEMLIDVRARGSTEWITSAAQPTGEGAWWQATFTSTIVPERRDREEPAVIEVRGHLMGARGGILLEIGADEPLEVEVLTKHEARTLDRILGVRPDAVKAGREFTLIGYVGAEGRAGTSARARALIGMGGRLTRRTELIVYVVVGPAFQRPALLEGGGPLVLGFEGALRVYTRDPESKALALFVESFATADVRLPGFDPGIGLRAGGSLKISAEVALEGSLGGSFVLFRAIDTEESSAVAGASGGLRFALRFGGRSDGAR